MIDTNKKAISSSYESALQSLQRELRDFKMKSLDTKSRMARAISLFVFMDGIGRAKRTNTRKKLSGFGWYLT